MDNSIVIGLVLQAIGSALLLGGYAPQIFKLHKTKNPTGISLLFWTMIATGCTFILANMIIQNTSIPVVITQALNMFFAWYTLILVIYCRNKSGQKFETPIYTKIIILGILSLISLGYQELPRQEFGYMLQSVGTFALLMAYIPQIIYLHKVKDATGISRWLFIILGGGLLLVTINMIITGTSKEIIITEFVNIALIMVQYFMTVYYQNKKKVI